MSQFRLFGIDAAGETAWCELLSDLDRRALRTVAADRLRRWHAVEIWEGPVCLIRVKRSDAGPA